MNETTKTKLLKLTKSISDKYYFLLIISVLLLINRDFFGTSPFLAVYSILVVTLFAATFCKAIVTGEAELKGFSFKKDEKPFSFYLILVMYIVIIVFFMFGLVAALQK